jgi:Domain of unknown function (DUF222)/HNH endonuclease
MDGELEQLGERIAEQAAHFDAAMHRLLTDLRKFDERGGWHVQGAMSCAHWLAWRVGWDLVTARERVRVARRLAEFPAIDDALRRGEISYSKVRALVRVATPANETLLLDHARLMTASQLEKLSRKYALVQRHCQDPHPRDDEQRRYVRRRDTEDGMVKIEAVLHPEEAELVWAMLNHAATRLAREPDAPTNNDAAESREPPLSSIISIDDSAESRQALSSFTSECTDDTAHITAGSETTSARSLLDQLLDEADALRHAEAVSRQEHQPSTTTPVSQQQTSILHERADAAKRAFSRADALVSLAQGYLRGDRPNRSPIEIMLTIPDSTLRTEVADPVEVGEMGESFLSRETVRRLSCDAGVVEVVEDDHGVPLSVGRKRRTIAGALKRALHKRDTACTYPGCTNRIFLEGHHIQHWADGGETSLKNAILLCSLHHRYVHEYGYAIEFGADQRPQFRNPHGRLVAAVPACPKTVDLGWPRIHAENAPLEIDAETIACEWDGKPVNYGAIVGHLVVADGLQ